MQVVVACNSIIESEIEQLRTIFLGAGLECSLSDFVLWGDLGNRLSRRDADLIIVRAVGSADDQSLQSDAWELLREGVSVTTSPILIVTQSNPTPELIGFSRMVGAIQILQEASLRDSLDPVLEKLVQTQTIERRRGSIYSVVGAGPGMGGTTVAVNLAVALAAVGTSQTALVELTNDFGDSAILLDVQPRHNALELCSRWESLDAVGFANSFADHPATNLKLLINSELPESIEPLEAEAVRRLVLLSRLTHAQTVLSLDYRIDESHLEAMNYSDANLLILRPDVTSLYRAQWLLRRADDYGVPMESFRLVINRWGQPYRMQIRYIEDMLQMRCWMELPEDPGRMNKAANKGKPVFRMAPRSALGRRFSRMATLLLHGDSKATSKKNETSRMKR